MTEGFSLERLIELVRARDAAPPRIDPVEAHVRSGVQFVFRDPLRRGVAAEVQDALKTAMGQGWLLGTFVAEWGFDVIQGKVGQLHQWLKNHEQDIVDCQPEGVAYRGTYAVFSTTEKNTGRYRTIWTFTDFAGMQNFGQRLADRDSPFSQLVADLVAFIDTAHAAGASQQIYQPAQGSLSIWQLNEPPPPSGP